MSFDRKEYIRGYQREWINKRRDEWFSDKKCCQCGSPEALELDHVEPTMKSRMSDHHVWSWAEERRKVELAKCQVLCHSCHKAKSIKEKRPHRPMNETHNLTTYWKGCRCRKCYAAVHEMRSRPFESHRREQA